MKVLNSSRLSKSTFTDSNVTSCLACPRPGGFNPVKGDFLLFPDIWIERRKTHKKIQGPWRGELNQPLQAGLPLHCQKFHDLAPTSVTLSPPNITDKYRPTSNQRCKHKESSQEPDWLAPSVNQSIEISQPQGPSPTNSWRSGMTISNECVVMLLQMSNHIPIQANTYLMVLHDWHATYQFSYKMLLLFTVLSVNFFRED